MDGDGWEEGGRVEGVRGEEKREREKPGREVEKDGALAPSSPRGRPRRPGELGTERAQAAPRDHARSFVCVRVPVGLCVRVGGRVRVYGRPRTALACLVKGRDPRPHPPVPRLPRQAGSESGRTPPGGNPETFPVSGISLGVRAVKEFWLPVPQFPPL